MRHQQLYFPIQIPRPPSPPSLYHTITIPISVLGFRLIRDSTVTVLGPLAKKA